MSYYATEGLLFGIWCCLDSCVANLVAVSLDGGGVGIYLGKSCVES